MTLTPSSRISPISQELGVITLELSIPYRMDKSCNFRTLTPTPFSKISLTSQESRVMTLESSIPYLEHVRNKEDIVALMIEGRLRRLDI